MRAISRIRWVILLLERAIGKLRLRLPLCLVISVITEDLDGIGYLSFGAGHRQNLRG